MGTSERVPDEPEEKTLGEGEPCPAFQCILLLPGSPSRKRRPFQAVFPSHPGPPLMKLKCLHLGGSVVPPAPAPSPGPGPRGHTPDALTRDGPHLAGVAAGVVRAGGAVAAGAGRALVHLVLAVAAGVARLAAAVVRGAGVHAEAPVPAQAAHVHACGHAGAGRVRPGRPPGAPVQQLTGRGADGHLAATRPPRRTRWARRSRGRSSRCGTRSGTGRWSASTCRRSCRARSRTSARGSAAEGSAGARPTPAAPTGRHPPRNLPPTEWKRSPTRSPLLGGRRGPGRGLSAFLLDSQQIQTTGCPSVKEDFFCRSKSFFFFLEILGN